MTQTSLKVRAGKGAPGGGNSMYQSPEAGRKWMVFSRNCGSAWSKRDGGETGGGRRGHGWRAVG